MTIKQFLDTPLHKLFNKDKRIKHDAKIILKGDLLNESQKKLFIRKLEQAGINLAGDTFNVTDLIKGPGDILGIIILVGIGIVTAMFAWWALLIWIIIVAVAVLIRWNK